jgi:Protein of unknown function (DUF3631)
MHTTDLCDALNTMDESPWSAANHGKPVDGFYLRTHLADFVPADAENIAPRKWRGPTGQARGYREKHFEDAFERYLDKLIPSTIPNTVSGGKADKTTRAWKGSKTRPGTDAVTNAETDKTASSAPRKTKQYQSFNSKMDGWTDETPKTPPRRARASGDPPEPQPDSNNQNEGSVTDFPRGASGRRRKRPKAGD